MYKIYMQNLSDASPTLIYQSDNKSENLIIEPKLSFEWQQPGSLDFSMLSGHPAYSDIHSMITFVTVYWDDEELFYGRVLTIDKSLHGQKDVYCEGALSFLADGEVQAYDSSTTAQAFFSKCLTDYNATVESRKQFTIGTCEFTDSGIYFKMEENTEARSALDEQLVKRLGGCMVVRKTASGHSLNYLKQVGTASSQKIRICENVQDRTDHDSGESVFTILRPIGANDIDTHETVKLSGSGVIEIPDMIAKYGRITKTENFNDQTTEIGLIAEAEKFIARLGMSTDKLPVTVDFSFVDFHYLNPSITRIHFGDVFEDIEGYEGETMVVGALELDLEDPKNDSLSLYNKTYLDAREYSALLETATGSASRGGSGGGGGSSLAKTLSSMEETEEEKFWKHVHATDDALILFGDRIQLAADLLIGSTREYDLLASDVEELYGTHLHGNGNGFWEMYGKIVRDEDGNITITDGAGLRVERTIGGVTTSFGVYDEETLTAGIMVDKLNDDNTTYILGDRIIIGNVATSYRVALVTGSDASNYSAINPHQLRYYELVNNQYIYSEDTVAKPNKTYYVKKIGLPADGSGLTANARLERESNRIGLVVEGYGADAAIRSAEIVAAINDDGDSEVLLRADRIKIDSTSGSSFSIDANGNMTFDVENAIAAINAATAAINADHIKLSATDTIALDARLSIEANTGMLQVTGDLIVGDTLWATDVSANSSIHSDITIDAPTIEGGYGRFAYLYCGSTEDQYGELTGGEDVSAAYKALQFIVDPNNSGHFILQGKTLAAPNTWTDAANFNIAATQFYQDGLEAEWAAAYAMVDMPDLNFSTGSFSVAVPSSTRGQQDTYAFTVQKDSTPSAYGNVSVYMNNLTVARVPIGDWYTAGDTAGYTRGYSAGMNDVGVYITKNGTWYTSWTIQSGDSETFYPAKWINGSYEVDYNRGLTVTATGGSSSHNILVGANNRYDQKPSNCVEIFEDVGAYQDLHGARPGWYTFKATCGDSEKWYCFRVGNP